MWYGRIWKARENVLPCILVPQTEIASYWTGDALVEDCAIVKRVVQCLFEVCGWAGGCCPRTGHDLHALETNTTARVDLIRVSLRGGRRHTACIVTLGGSSPPGWVGDSRCGHPRKGSRSERALCRGSVHWEMLFPCWQGFFETRSLDILTCQFCHQCKKQRRHSGPVV